MLFRAVKTARAVGMGLRLCAVDIRVVRRTGIPYQPRELFIVSVKGVTPFRLTRQRRSSMCFEGPNLVQSSLNRLPTPQKFGGRKRFRIRHDSPCFERVGCMTMMNKVRKKKFRAIYFYYLFISWRACRGFSTSPRVRHHACYPRYKTGGNIMCKNKNRFQGKCFEKG